MHVKHKTLSVLLAATFAASMAWGAAPADVSQTVAAKAGASVKVHHLAKAPAYTGKTLQNTRNGLVQGYVQDTALIWKGIPYGQAERWKAPTDAKAWNGVFDATKPGPVAIQGAIGKTKGSEDCLNLDIFRPNTKEKNLPVLFFIHGGNNQSGAADQANWQKFAEREHVVAISINHRLGALGFNPLPALKHGTAEENSGNFAVLDFVRGLDWTKENIASFGGNPDNITIAGFSSGGRDVMALLISPIAKGKFQKAISFSGGMTTSDTAWAQQIFARHFAPLVVADGIKTNEADAAKWLLQDTQEVRNYLQNLPADRVAAAFGRAAIRMNAFPHLYNDGVVLEKNSFATKNYNQVPLIMTTGTDEFSLYTRTDDYFVPSVKDGTIFTDPEKHSEFAFAKKYGSKLYELFNAEESAVTMFDHYGKAPIYTLKIAYGNDPKLVGEKMAFTSGSVHGIWIPFATGIPTATTAGYPAGSFDNPGALALTAQVQDYLGNFMRTGNPNGKGLVRWEKWTSATEGPSQLYVNSDGTNVDVHQEYGRTTYQSVLDEIVADTSIKEDAKAEIIRHVLSGRWFSKGFDAFFHNN
ncbi:carboxylesterase family protein [uncultured Megasphaera sp.]|uniref:carboxylesterase family protein n=1 Tax=uncultured Megasphaera sp. TaxID=165188 RepID=UPI0025F8CADB|nr:carboxylesterase family protein [uncultured Megasphaera sp.]